MSKEILSVKLNQRIGDHTLFVLREDGSVEFEKDNKRYTAREEVSQFLANLETELHQFLELEFYYNVAEITCQPITVIEFSGRNSDEETKEVRVHGFANGDSSSWNQPCPEAFTRLYNKLRSYDNTNKQLIS